MCEAGKRNDCTLFEMLIHDHSRTNSYYIQSDTSILVYVRMSIKYILKNTLQVMDLD